MYTNNIVNIIYLIIYNILYIFFTFVMTSELILLLLPLELLIYVNIIRHRIFILILQFW